MDRSGECGQSRASRAAWWLRVVLCASLLLGTAIHGAHGKVAMDAYPSDLAGEQGGCDGHPDGKLHGQGEAGCASAGTCAQFLAPAERPFAISAEGRCPLPASERLSHGTAIAPPSPPPKSTSHL